MSTLCNTANTEGLTEEIPELNQMTNFKPYCNFSEVLTDNLVTIKVNDDAYFIQESGIGHPSDISDECTTSSSHHQFTIVLNRVGSNPNVTKQLKINLPYFHNPASGGEEMYIYVYDRSETDSSKTKGISKSAVPIKRETGV